MLVLHPSSRCDICLDDYTWVTPTNSPHAISCGHIFCLTCLRALHPSTCPLCRKHFLTDRIKKLHVDKAPDEPDGTNALIESHSLTLLQRVVLISGENASDADVAGVIQEVMEWLSTQSDDLSSNRPLQAAVKALRQHTAAREKLAEKRLKCSNLERQLSSLEHTFEQDTKTAKAIEESLVMELAEVEARYTAKLQTAQAQITSLQQELARYTSTHNPLPPPPQPLPLDRFPSLALPFPDANHFTPYLSNGAYPNTNTTPTTTTTTNMNTNTNTKNGAANGYPTRPRTTSYPDTPHHHHTPRHNHTQTRVPNTAPPTHTYPPQPTPAQPPVQADLGGRDRDRERGRERGSGSGGAREAPSRSRTADTARRFQYQYPYPYPSQFPVTDEEDEGRYAYTHPTTTHHPNPNSNTHNPNPNSNPRPNTTTHTNGTRARARIIPGASPTQRVIPPRIPPPPKFLREVGPSAASFEPLYPPPPHHSHHRRRHRGSSLSDGEAVGAGVGEGEAAAGGRARGPEHRLESASAYLAGYGSGYDEGFGYGYGHHRTGVSTPRPERRAGGGAGAGWAEEGLLAVPPSGETGVREYRTLEEVLGGGAGAGGEARLERDLNASNNTNTTNTNANANATYTNGNTNTNTNINTNTNTNTNANTNGNINVNGNTTMPPSGRSSMASSWGTVDTNNTAAVRGSMSDLGLVGLHRGGAVGQGSVGERGSSGTPVFAGGQGTGWFVPQPGFVVERSRPRRDDAGDEEEVEEEEEEEEEEERERRRRPRHMRSLSHPAVPLSTPANDRQEDLASRRLSLTQSQSQSQSHTHPQTQPQSASLPDPAGAGYAGNALALTFDSETSSSSILAADDSGGRGTTSHAMPIIRAPAPRVGGPNVLSLWRSGA